MDNKLPTKFSTSKTTIFTVMSRLANQYGALNLSQGFPDYAVDPLLIQLIDKYLKKGYNQYASMLGVELLPERISEKYQSLYQLKIDKEN